MRSDTKLKIARRKHTLGLLKWLYSRRNAQLDGTKLSLEYRRSFVDHDTRSLTYGEVDVPDFLSILDLVKPQNEVFVDLGSGTGKAVLTAACGFPELLKCRGIELVQGLADAAADHLQTAKTFLATPRAPAHNMVSTNDVMDAALAGERTTPGASRASFGKEKLGQGGNGGRKGKKTSGSKALNQGLNACDLEALIAELLNRQASASHAGGERETGRNATATAARDLRGASAEEIASWLVREMGHRRYKSSLRGYGGLQKFLIARRRASDASSRLSITEDGTRVTVCLADECPSALHPSSSQPRDAAAGERCEEETTHRSGFVEHYCRRACCDTHDDAEAASSSAATVVPLSHSSEIDNGKSWEDGSPPPSTTCEALPTACSLTSHMLGLSCVDSTPGDGTICKDGSIEDVVNRRRLPEPGPLTAESLAGVELICGDIFEEAWDDAGVVYVASLLFDESMMALLAQRVQRLRPGARIISLKPIPAPESSRELTGPRDVGVREGDQGVRQDNNRDSAAAGVDPGLKLLHEGVFRMSWQMARVYIYVRL
ncbi:unnamed protein product [Ectocarpus sp. 12 AP-2014]